MAKRRSHTQHNFSTVPQAKIPRSSFSRPSTLKTTFDAGLLVPIFLDEVLPGDTHNMRASFFGRLATPLKPVMDNLFMDVHWFFCPTRLLWENWQRFNGEQDSPGDSIDYSVPQMAPVTHGEDNLSDYLGLPTKTANPYSANALPFRMYNRVWHEWYRDQNLQNGAVLNVDDGPDSWSGGAYALRRRGKRKDYFSSALPFEQKGDPVTVPLGEEAPIFTQDPVSPGVPVRVGIKEAPGAVYRLGGDYTGGSFIDYVSSIDGTPNLYADLASATGFTINQLRESFQIQKLLERDARGGTRYTEILRSHFGVISPDARLQRPEFLGGSTTMININPVAQTSDQISGGPGGETPQGNMAAFGTVSIKRSGFVKSFTEHGYIMGLVSVRADLTYQQGLDRLWSRTGRYDFYWPALSNLGEQAILSGEIYKDGSAADEDVWGYIPRWDEYRYKTSKVTGAFRSNHSSTLHFWHYAQDFENRPSLDQDYIQEDPPVGRTLAVPDEPHMLLDCYFNLRSARPMPVFGVPGLIDHF
jgi:hypothetical protein